MHKRTKMLLVGAAVATAAVFPAIARAGSGQEEPDGTEIERPITGPDLDRASRVALDLLGEGTVTGTEIEDEESYYEVEVTLEDGRQVDVQLDEQFNVVGSESDTEND